MKRIKIIFTLIIICVVIQANNIQPVSVYININSEQQTIHSWGVSDAWRCQFVGKYWPIEKKEQIAEWLFSKEVDKKGNPKGIGISTWRFYLGAGSSQQGKNSGIKNEWRRGESFLTSDGTYDWSKQEGQQWFLRKAKSYGVDNFLAFMISPPVQFTLNGKAFSDTGRSQLNIKSGHIIDFAKYMANVVEHFNKAEKLPINYISPMNEPQWGWNNGSQEGSPASNEDLYLLTKYLSTELQKRDVDCNIILGEAGKLEHLSDYNIESSDTVKRLSNIRERADQINFFFNPQSATYIGDFPNVEYAMSGHSYFSTWPIKTLISTRKRLHLTIERINPNLNFWQSEYCILEKNDDIGQGKTRDLGMGTALFVARVIYSDLVFANATSWQWWTALSQCDYKDGLIYLDRINKENIKYNGVPIDSKLLWAFGNYSRFIRPGMKRVNVDYLSNVSDIDKLKSLMISAYKSEKEIVMVAVNYTNIAKRLKLKGIGNIKDYKISIYETSDKKSLKLLHTKSSNPVISPRSVTTIILSSK